MKKLFAFGFALLTFSAYSFGQATPAPTKKTKTEVAKTTTASHVTKKGTGNSSKTAAMVSPKMDKQPVATTTVKPAPVTKTPAVKTKAATTTPAAKGPMKKDGTPDKRYNANKKLKKDGTPDKRFKENKKN